MSQRIAFWTPYFYALVKFKRAILTRKLGGGLWGGKSTGADLIKHDVAPFPKAKIGFKIGQKTQSENLLKGQFNWSNQTLDVGINGTPWTQTLPSMDFARWLHSFDWLQDLIAPPKNIGHMRALNYVDSWIDSYGKGNDFSWQVDILSKRLFNWFVIWTPILASSASNVMGQSRRNCVYRQLKLLKNRFKHSDPGIARLRAAAVLAMGGAKLSDHGQGFLARGLDLLEAEIETQILADGGHISRSPHDCLEALTLLLVLDKVLQAGNLESSQILSRALDRLTPIIAFFQHSDGSLASFHGSGAGNVDRIERLLRASPAKARAFGYCPHMGYQRMEFGPTIMIVDTGSAPIRPFDIHTHMAPLSLELSSEHGCILVNCGWNPEQPRAWQRPVRAAAAHNTLILNNQSPGKLLPQGWKTRILGEAVLRDTGPVNAQRKEQKVGAWLESQHDGYRKQYGLCHRRRLFIAHEGDDIRGEDSLYVPLGDVPRSQDLLPFDIRFHVHPNVKISLSQDQHSALLVVDGKSGWRFRTDSGPLRIEPSVYLGEGAKPVKTEQLVISGKAYADSDGETKSNRVRWSFRELKSRAE